MPIDLLMTAVVQDQDIDKAIKALNEAGVEVTLLASSGGFLGRHNATLLVGLEANQEKAALAALSQACRRRVEYVATSLEGAPFHMPLSTPISVGGATVFTFEVERFEVF